MAVDLDRARDEVLLLLASEMRGRAVEASHALRNAALNVLRGRRTGRRYRVPGTMRYYTASAPGEPPAVRTGLFRLSWHVDPKGGKPGIQTFQADLAEWLEKGTIYMEPRPYVEATKARAWPAVKRIYRRKYLR